MQRPLIVIGTPCFGGLVTNLYMLSVCKLLRVGGERGMTFDIALLANDALISRARSTVAAYFLDNPAATHLMFIDADISFEPEQFFRLFEADKDIAAGFYPVKTIDWEAVPRRVVQGEKLDAAGLTYVGTPLTGPEERRDGDFVAAKYAGTGFQLIKRGVFDRLAEAYPELHFKKMHTLGSQVPQSDRLYALFDCLIDPETGEYLSEDYAFCRRWRALGGEIWLDTKSKLTHSGMQAFRGDTTLRYGATAKTELASSSVVIPDGA
jgi:hypothetical protein